MALIKCHECGGDVSTEAVACPSCGAKPKDKRLRTKVRSWIFRALAFVIVIFAVVAWVSSQSGGSKSGNANPVAQPDNPPSPRRTLAAENTALPEFSGTIQQDIASIERLNSKCRGGSGDLDSTMDACRQRDMEMGKIRGKGWCYGHEGQAGYEQTWEKCQAKPKTQTASETNFEKPLITGPSTLVCPIDILFDRRENHGLKAAIDAHIKIFGHDEAIAKSGCEEWRAGEQVTLSDKAKQEAKEAQAAGKCQMIETEGRLMLSCELKNAV